MVLWWRLFYGVINSRWFVTLLRAAIAVANRVKPDAALTLLEVHVGEAWPLRVPGWVNVHISGLLWRLRRTAVVQAGPRRDSARLCRPHWAMRPQRARHRLPWHYLAIPPMTMGQNQRQRQPASGAHHRVGPP